MYANESTSSHPFIYRGVRSTVPSALPSVLRRTLSHRDQRLLYRPRSQRASIAEIQPQAQVQVKPLSPNSNGAPDTRAGLCPTCHAILDQQTAFQHTFTEAHHSGAERPTEQCGFCRWKAWVTARQALWGVDFWLGSWRRSPAGGVAARVLGGGEKGWGPEEEHGEEEGRGCR
ncbi:hypothetical protein AAE478_009063 [Parahypoxylon ruwenzoriense]